MFWGGLGESGGHIGEDLGTFVEGLLWGFGQVVWTILGRLFGGGTQSKPTRNFESAYRNVVKAILYWAGEGLLFCPLVRATSFQTPPMNDVP